MSDERPALTSPAPDAVYAYDDLIEFNWTLAKMTTIRAKLDLYVGPNQGEPWKDAAAVRSWDLRPRSYWTSFRDYPVHLKLERHQTYFWMVAQEDPGHGMSLLSDVRRLSIRGQDLAPRLRLEFAEAVPARVSSGVPVGFTARVRNVSNGPVRLFFRSSQHFDVAVYQQRGVLADKLIWRPVAAWAQSLDAVDLSPGAEVSESFEWLQRNQQGDRVLGDFSYRIVVRCLADECPGELTHTVRVAL